MARLGYTAIGAPPLLASGQEQRLEERGGSRVRTAAWMALALVAVYGVGVLCSMSGPIAPVMEHSRPGLAPEVRDTAKETNKVMNMTVVLAAFEPFGNFSINPAQNVSKILDGKCIDSICFRAMSIPVNHAGVQMVPNMLIHTQDLPHAVIHLGLDASAHDVMVEIVAANVAAIDGDKGKLETSQVVTEASHGAFFREIAPGFGLSYLLPTTADLAQLYMDFSQPRTRAAGSVHATSFARFQEHEMRVAFSRDLGAFFCNEAYFRTLFAVHQAKLRVESVSCAHTQRLLPVLFVHLPLLSTIGAEDASTVVAKIARSILLVSP
ncbi:Pyrrolidone-carboxylate peptidase [Porphyridium purpureum]|uniref:Pyrrolidone-carboxylate peptidase n=1 Tax=Porphyridium purpureum TaxID=35688 RepID=A0A5J4YW24_PORPP|nr:Pyrrolidone-carboxylate peptidase [Porphyridium purpureum]|eukprot:POR6837..scf227_4